MDPYRPSVLASRPRGVPTSENFRLETGPIPVTAHGQILLRTQYLSLDPYMRGRMNEAKSYAAPVSIGGVSEGGGGGEGLGSNPPDYPRGGIVPGGRRWRKHAARHT